MKPAAFHLHPRSASSSPPRIPKARPPTGRIARLILLCATAFMHADTALAASGAFDGTYKGTFVLTSALSTTASVQCENNTLEQVMSISGNQVYFDRKTPYANPLLLSGTVSSDGSVSANGVAGFEGGDRRSVTYFTLVGTITNGVFDGRLSNRYCDWKISMRK
jgi:hypothetical protein